MPTLVTGKSATGVCEKLNKAAKPAHFNTNIVHFCPNEINMFRQNIANSKKCCVMKVSLIELKFSFG